MRECDFKNWMEKLGTMQKRPIGDAISRCKRIERDLTLNLDSEYTKDGGKSLIENLEYSLQDAIDRKPLPGKLSFPGAPENVRNSMNSLRGAAKKYIEFRRSE